MAGVLFSPGETFSDIARKPDILVPLLVILVLSYVMTFFTMQRMDWSAITEQQIEQAKARNPNLSEQDLAKMERITQAIGKVMGWIGPLFIIVWLVIMAALLLLGFRLFGGEGTFQQSFSTVLYSWMPMLVGSIVATIVVIARGKFDPTHAATLVKSNPAFLVDMKDHPVLFSFLSAFDVFTIWMLVLLVIGCAAFSKTSRAKAAAIVLSLWALFILIFKVGFPALGALMAGKAKA